MSDFKPGDIVDITIKGVRIVPTDRALPNDPRGLVTIADEHGDLWPLPPQAAVTRVAPPDWPPQPGDLWQDDDKDVWFAVYADDRLFMHGRFGGVFEPHRLLAEYGPLVLVRAGAAR